MLRLSGEQEIRIEGISTAGYQVKKEGWQGLGLPALNLNVMVCGCFGRFGFFESAYYARRVFFLFN